MQIIQYLAAVSFLISILQFDHARAFACLPQKHHQTMTVFGSSRSSLTALFMHTEDEHGDFFDVETARRQLESLVTEASGSSSKQAEQEEASRSWTHRPVRFVGIESADSASPLPESVALDISLPARPALTTIERKRRSAEIRLLARLDDGDEVLSDIWDLWFSERGSAAEELLRDADDLIEEGSPDSWNQAEVILRGLIDHYGVYFVEPVNRLSLLYFLQGRQQEALVLNKIVLSIKPWHFGALSRIVMIYAKIKDNSSARQWASFRLPTFTSVGANRRRTRWVEKAVVDATASLHQGETELLELFGDSDKKWIAEKSLETDADAWQ